MPKFELINLSHHSVNENVMIHFLEGNITSAYKDDIFGLLILESFHKYY